MKRPARAFLGIIALILATSGVRADRIVFFKSGRAMVVSAVEEKGGWYFLNFVGGGVLGVPAAAIDRVEETDLAQELGNSFGNTIQAPDPSRAGARPASSARLPGQSRVDPGSPNTLPPGMQRANPQMLRQGPSAGTPRPGGPLLKNDQSAQPGQLPQVGPFGLIPLNPNPIPDADRQDPPPEDEEEEEEEE